MEERLKYEDLEDEYEMDDESDIEDINNNDYFEEDDYTQVASKSRKKRYEDIQNVDTGYFCTFKNVNGKMYKIEMYNSGVTIGNKIRDAITGAYYNYKIGSKYEDLFFKIRMTTGTTKTNVTLYYFSISDYEKHQKTIVSDVVKQRWTTKKNFRENELV